MITVWFVFNVAAMEGIYTKRLVIIPVTKQLYPWFRGEGSKFWSGMSLYVERKLIHVFGRRSVKARIFF